jgi:hypothetical protein
MEALEKSIENVTRRWDIIRSALFAIIVVTFLGLAATFSTNLILIAAFGSGWGILFGAWALLKGDWLWSRAAILIGGVMLSVAVLIQVASRTIVQALPGLLLAYVLILFSAEALALTRQHQAMYSKDKKGPQASSVMLQKSVEHMTRKIIRLGSIFGGCYVITLAVLVLGDVFVTALPSLSDISLYIVAVSISLALLLILGED